MPLSPGTRLGAYEIRSPLGAGGMGEVYEAYDSRLRRRVALKVLPEALAADEEHRERFEREARAIAALSHPNIVVIYSVEQADGVPFLTMELVEGRPLTALMPAGGFPLERLLPIGISLADAVSAAHARGITHRDLKPGNILISDDGRVKVLDFGLAKLTDPVGGSIAGATDLPTQSLSDVGRIVGTVAYMSPEQAEGKAVGPRSDLFALGIILYELATGARPFKGDSTASLLSAILRDTPPPITATHPTLPPELARIIRRCLEKDPARRLQTALDLRNELEEIRTAVLAAVTPPLTVPSRRHRRTWLVGATAVMLVLAAAFAAWRWWSGGSADGTAIDSVAVLPFVNASGSPDADYLADGLAETLTNSLAQIQTLRVIPRAMTLRYRGQTVDPLEAGRFLKARAIVTGRVVQHGDRLTVQVQLIDTVRVAQLGGEQQFDRPLLDALAMQGEISKAMVDKLRLRLSHEDEKHLAPGTSDPAAYQLYLKGRYEWNKRNKDSLVRATEYYEEAIKHDSSFALAHAGLAGAYVARGYFGYLPPADGFPKGMAAARTALNLDERSADAHSVLGTAILYYDWKWPESEREHLRALEIDSGNVDARFRYAATLLRSMGRYDEAIAEFQRAGILDPLLPSIPAGLGQVLTYAHRYDEGIVALKQALDMEHTFVAAHRDLAVAYRLKGMNDLAIAESQQTITMGEPSGTSLLAQSYVAAGRRADAVALLEELMARGKSPGGARGVAAVFAALGDTTQALAWLERAYTEHDPNLVFLNTGPEFDALRADSRFKDLVRRVGIPAR